MLKKKKIIRSRIWFKRVKYKKLNSGECLCDAISCKLSTEYQKGNHHICEICSNIEDDIDSKYWGDPNYSTYVYDY